MWCTCVLNSTSASCLEDFRDGTYSEDCAMEQLANAYASVLGEFAWQTQTKTLRLLPISGGIFCGPFQPFLLTFQALSAGWEMLSLDTQEILNNREVEMCIFMEGPPLPPLPLSLSLSPPPPSFSW
jgi:hypothetical protein